MAVVKRGKFWHVQFTAPDGERVRQSARTTDRRQAEELEAVLKARAWRQTKLDETQSTWAEAVVSWLRSTTHKDRAGTEERLRWLDRFLGGMILRDIDRRTLHAIRDAKLREGVKPATLNRHLAAVSAVLNHAHKSGMLDSVPPIPKMKETKGRLRWLTPAEARQLLDALRAMPRCGHVVDMVELALATGLREANITGLRWEQVRPDHLWIPDTKSGKPLRVPLNESALAVIERRRGDHPEFVFTYRGKRIRKAGSDGFRSAVQACGWTDVTFHTLRHTWASWHVQAGTPLAVLQQLGGWSTYQMVLRYAHLAPDHVDAYAKNIVTNLAQ